MARRVFFSFHYDGDSWRANQVRQSNVVYGVEKAGFFDHSEYEEAKRQGSEGIAKMILRNLQNTTVTVVLIGLATAYRPWVSYEISQSIARKNGLIGIRIHHLKDQNGRTSPPGPLPTVSYGVEFPTYDWDGDVNRFKLEIEKAGTRAEALRKVR